MKHAKIFTHFINQKITIMKKIFSVAFLCMLSVSTLFAQLKAPAMSFDKIVYDFGEIKEADGPVTHKFEFLNTGSEAVILKNVRASCGCTTPSWSKKPVLPGHKGFISAIYNPAHRPGKFNKTVTITSNCKPATIKLTIKGDVIPKPKTLEDKFPYKIGDLRFAAKNVSFMRITPKQSKTNTIGIVNTSDKPSKLTFVNVPKHLIMKTIPAVIAPKQEGRIVVTFNAALKNEWDFVSDYIGIKINNELQTRQKIAVTANIEEDFSKLTPEQRANAPKAVVDNKLFQLGEIKKDEKKTHKFTIKNTGKEPLKIHQVKPTCNCVTYTLDKKIIAPGKSAVLKATFDAKNQKGKQSKLITLVTNSPSNSKIRLYIKGVVNY